MPFLVGGATGRTGAGVVRHLQAAGEQARILVRDADKAKGTFEDLDGIEIVVGAFDDNDRAHPSIQRGGRRFPRRWV